MSHPVPPPLPYPLLNPAWGLSRWSVSSSTEGPSTNGACPGGAESAAGARARPCGGPVRPLLPTARPPQACPGCPWHRRASSATTGDLGARGGTAEAPPVSATWPLLAAVRSPQSCPHRAPAITIGLPQSHLRVPDATQEPLPPKSHYRGATSAKGEQSLTSSHHWHRRAATKAPPLQGHLHGHRDTTATTELPLPP